MAIAARKAVPVKTERGEIRKRAAGLVQVRLQEPKDLPAVKVVAQRATADGRNLDRWRQEQQNLRDDPRWKRRTAAKWRTEALQRIAGRMVRRADLRGIQGLKGEVPMADLVLR